MSAPAEVLNLPRRPEPSAYLDEMRAILGPSEEACAIWSRFDPHLKAYLCRVADVPVKDWPDYTQPEKRSIKKGVTLMHRKLWPLGRLR